MSEAIYFIEIASSNEKLYKLDTFWSLGKNYKTAKLHSDDKHDQDRFFKSLIYSLFNELPISDKRIEHVNNALYGYQTIEYDSLGERILTKTVYLKMFVNVTNNSYEVIDYLEFKRNDNIEKIIEK